MKSLVMYQLVILLHFSFFLCDVYSNICIVIKSKEILNINDSFDIQVSLIVLVVLVAAINSDSAADNLPQMRQVTFLFTND
jgi:hypothetical protein